MRRDGGLDLVAGGSTPLGVTREQGKWLAHAMLEALAFDLPEQSDETACKSIVEHRFELLDVPTCRTPREAGAYLEDVATAVGVASKLAATQSHGAVVSAVCDEIWAALDMVSRLLLTDERMLCAQRVSSESAIQEREALADAVLDTFRDAQGYGRYEDAELLWALGVVGRARSEDGTPPRREIPRVCARADRFGEATAAFRLSARQPSAT